MHRTQKIVRDAIEPFRAPLCEMYDRAWATYNEIPEHIRAIVNMDPRAVASVIWVLVNHEATKYFYPLGITPRPIHNTNVFSMPGGKVVLRFKKTDSTGATSNYRTPRSVSYDAGLLLEDTPEPLRVAVGWVPREAGNGYSDLLITLRGPETWCYSIIENEEITGLFDEVAPSETGPIIRPRHAEDADEADNGEERSVGE